MDHSGYSIKRSLVLRDTLDKCDMHIDALENGNVRFCVVIPKADGISRHIVFEYEAIKKGP